MLRTVKAWMAMPSLRERRSPLWWGIAFGARTSAVTGARRVPITITWDDGRPAPRKRTTGTKGGRRGR